MVEPTNLNPRFWRSRLMRSDRAVLAGISLNDLNLLFTGFRLMNPQMYRSKVPNPFRIMMKALALPTAALILSRLRIIPLSLSRAAILREPYFATLLKSKLSNALLKFSLLFGMVLQLRPA